MLQLVFFELDKSNVNNDMLEEMLDMLELDMLGGHFWPPFSLV